MDHFKDINFVLGEAGCLPGFDTFEFVNGREFYQTSLSMKELKEMWKGKELCVDGMLFVYLVAAFHTQTVIDESEEEITLRSDLDKSEEFTFRYIIGEHACELFITYQEFIQVYCITPPTRDYQQAINVMKVPCQWIIQDGSQCLGLTQNGVMRMELNEWSKLLKEHYIKEGIEAQKEGGNPEVFATEYRNMVEGWKMYFWHRGAIGDSSKL